MPIAENPACLPGRNCPISRHYRTFIQMPLDYGVDCGSSCETVTIYYLNANQYLMSRFACPVCLRTVVVDQDPA